MHTEIHVLIMYAFNLHTFCINVYAYLFCSPQNSSQINVHNWNSIPAMYIKYHLNERLKKSLILRLRSPTLARYWRHLMMYKLEMPATVSLIQVLKLEQSCGTTVAENLGSYWRTEITANSDARRINVLLRGAPRVFTSLTCDVNMNVDGTSLAMLD